MKNILLCIPFIVIFLGYQTFAQGKGKGRALGHQKKQGPTAHAGSPSGAGPPGLVKKGNGPTSHAGPPNAAGPPGLVKKGMVPASLTWEERRNSIMERMQARVQDLGTKLGKPAALEAPPTALPWSEQREQILTQLKASRAELVSKINQDRAVLAEKRQVAAANSIDNKPLVDTVSATDTTKPDVVGQTAEAAGTGQVVKPDAQGPQGSGAPGFHVNDVPLIDLADARDPWSQIGGDGANAGVPAMLIPALPNRQGSGVVTGSSGVDAGGGVPLGPNPGIPLGTTGGSPGIPIGTQDPKPGTPLGPVNPGVSQEPGVPVGPGGGLPLGEPGGQPAGSGAWFDPSLGSGQAAILRDVDISQFFSSGEVSPVTNNVAPPRTGASQGIQTVGGAVMPRIETSAASSNSRSVSNSGGSASSLLGFVSGISSRLRNNG